MSRLTDMKVFEPEFDERSGMWKRARYFLPGAAMQHDIHLSRTPVGGMREATGEHLGDALTDIEQHYVVHSPTGFEWGYGGSGPADLALNILGLFVPPSEAWRLHQYYKADVIARLHRQGPHTITAESVREWIRAQWAVQTGPWRDEK